MKNNKFKEGQLDIINDNVNVSKTNEIKDFFILLFYIVIFISVLFFLSDKLAVFYITKMPDSTQMKIEKLFGPAPEPSELEKKYAKQLNQLEIIKQKI